MAAAACWIVALARLATSALATNACVSQLLVASWGHNAAASKMVVGDNSTAVAARPCEFALTIVV
jgi:hypothetical protein